MSLAGESFAGGRRVLPGPVAPVPELKLTDKMFRDGRFIVVVERLLYLSQKWPSHPTIRYRLITAYLGINNPELVRGARTPTSSR